MHRNLKFNSSILKSLVKESGLSLSKLSEQLSIDKSTLSRIMNNFQIPRPESVKQFADYFGIDVSQFYSQKLDNKVKRDAYAQLRNNINFLMLKHGIISLTNLNKLSKIPRSNLERLLNKDFEPSLKTLNQLANFFKVSVDQLFVDGIIKGTNLVQVPLIDWFDSLNLDNLTYNVKSDILVGNISKKAFACILNNSDMEPQFSIGSTLIFDPLAHIENKCFCLAYIKKKIVFRKVLIDGQDIYLKAINPLIKPQLEYLEQSDKIIAKLIEAR